MKKETEERIRKENQRIAAIEARCQIALADILAAESLEARIVFYPKQKV